MNNYKNLEKKLGIEFKNPKLLIEALTHRSYLNEVPQEKRSSNERLEFLGDSILSFIISEWLFSHFPHSPEGTLTAFRSNLVKTETLAKTAQKLSLGNYLFLSKGERKSGGQENPTILANTLEAVVGAIFLDRGLDLVKKFIHSQFKTILQNLTVKGELKDFKSLLQEKTQAKNKLSPTYKTVKEAGPSHAKVFTVEVFLGKKLLGKGQGKSKQAAEEEAAKNALEKLK